MTEIVYRSRIDRWVRVACASAAAVAVVACVPLLLYGSTLEWLVMVPMLVVGVGLPVWVTTTTEYRLGDHTLAIRSGPFRWSIALREITAVTPTKNAISSPALSLDRLRIDYAANSSIMISPEDVRRFVADLKARGVKGV